MSPKIVPDVLPFENVVAAERENHAFINRVAGLMMVRDVDDPVAINSWKDCFDILETGTGIQ